jgi:hypothetical protein
MQNKCAAGDWYVYCPNPFYILYIFQGHVPNLFQRSRVLTNFNTNLMLTYSEYDALHSWDTFLIIYYFI